MNHENSYSSESDIIDIGHVSNDSFYHFPIFVSTYLLSRTVLEAGYRYEEVI